MDKELALYLHFPFCKSKCFYCDFNSYSGRDELIPGYIDSLTLEMQLSLPQQYRVSSVYFGGGTPSYIPVGFLIELLYFIKRQFLITSFTEITVEINPGTVHLDDLIFLKETGFNRLSIGLQTVQNDLLKAIGRIHSWNDFATIYELARETGFSNVGVDLIFGLPGQTLSQWEEDLAQVTALGPEHISVYGLQLEIGTPIETMINNGELTLPEEDDTVAMMKLAMKFLPEKGYEHYEISNYAKPGYRSKHNTGYWLGRNYLGFGAGATSTNYGERWTNIKDPGQYIDDLKNGRSPIASKELIDRRLALIEAVMLGLRLRDGIDLKKHAMLYRTDIIKEIGDRINDFVEKGLLVLIGDNLALTDAGILISNYVIAELINNL